MEEFLGPAKGRPQAIRGSHASLIRVKTLTYYLLYNSVKSNISIQNLFPGHRGLRAI